MAELDGIDVVEYARWFRYFELKHRHEQEAIEQAKRKGRRF